MKKLISFGLILLLMSSLSIGCGKSSEPAQTNPASTQNGDQTDNSAAKTPDDLGAKLSATYADMMKNKKYLMKYKMTSTVEGKSMEIEATVAMSGNNTAVTSTAEGMETTMLSLGEKTYMVNHSEKIVMELPQGSPMKNETNNEIQTDGLTYVSSGVEDGLTYEKYSTTDGIIKYYFKDNKLVKISFEVDGQSMVMNIIEMSSTVPDSMFEIPSNYEKVSLSN